MYLNNTALLIVFHIHDWSKHYILFCVVHTNNTVFRTIVYMKHGMFICFVITNNTGFLIMFDVCISSSIACMLIDITLILSTNKNRIGCWDFRTAQKYRWYARCTWTCVSYYLCHFKNVHKQIQIWITVSINILHEEFAVHVILISSTCYNHL